MGTSVSQASEVAASSDYMQSVSPNTPPRVIYLTDLVPSGRFGSLEEQTLNLAKEFASRGSLFLPVFGGPPAHSVVEQYAKYNLEIAGLNLHELSFHTLRALLRLIRSHRISIVHWNFYSPINPYVALLSVLAPGLKHVVTDHTSRTLPLPLPPTGIKRLLKKTFFRRYGQVLCISDFVVDCLVKDGTWSNLVRCTHFINTERFKPDADLRAKGRKEHQVEDKFLVLYVGQLIKEKGVDSALRALSLLDEKVVLWLVGSGDQRSYLEGLAKELGIEHRVRFWGPQDNVEPFMKVADCFVCPSIWGEATGLVNLEALASELPVVASEIGGIPEFVENGRTGLLFPPGDHETLARQISRLVADPELHRKLSKAARVAAVEQFSIERRLPEYVRQYSS